MTDNRHGQECPCYFGMPVPRSMMRATVIFFTSLCLVSALWAEENPASNTFDSQIAPLLSDRCLDCHSGREPKGKLDLSSRTSAFAGGESGAALVPGDVES